VCGIKRGSSEQQPAPRKSRRKDIYSDHLSHRRVVKREKNERLVFNRNENENYFNV
jgi:hypothetical protein